MRGLTADLAHGHDLSTRVGRVLRRRVELARELHPARTLRWVGSDANPWRRRLGPAAGAMAAQDSGREVVWPMRSRS